MRLIVLLVVTFLFVSIESVTRRILIAVTNHAKLGNTNRTTGWWLSEVAHPYHVFTKEHNFVVDFISPCGGFTPVDEGSVESAEQSKDEDSMDFYRNKEVMDRVGNITLSPKQLALPTKYDVIVYAGGHGTCWDFPDAIDLGKIASDIYRNGGIVSAVCHGPTGLLNVIDPHYKGEGTKLLIHGRKVTGFSNKEEEAVGLQDIVPFSLENELKSNGGVYSSAPEMWQSHVVVDGRLVTGQNPGSAQEMAVEIAKLLTHNHNLGLMIGMNVLGICICLCLIFSAFALMIICGVCCYRIGLKKRDNDEYIKMDK